MVKEVTMRIPWLDVSVRLSFASRRAETATLREYRIASRTATAELRATLMRRIANGRKS